MVAKIEQQQAGIISLLKEFLEVQLLTNKEVSTTTIVAQDISKQLTTLEIRTSETEGCVKASGKHISNISDVVKDILATVSRDQRTLKRDCSGKFEERE